MNNDTITVPKTTTGESVWWPPKPVRGCAWCGVPECRDYDHARLAAGRETTWREVAA